MVAWLLPAITAGAALWSAKTSSSAVRNAKASDAANAALARENLAFQREQHEYDKYANSPQGLREMAEGAGFNPLAFIGANIGPTQGFAGAPLMTDSTTGALATLSATQMDIANVAARFQELQNDKRRVELLAQELMQKVDRNIGPYGNKQTSNRPITKISLNSSNESSASEPVVFPNDPDVPSGFNIAPEAADQFPIVIGPGVLSPSPVSSADAFEQQYGEPLSWVWGVGKLAADTYFTGVNWALRNGDGGVSNPKRGEMIKKSIKPVKKFHGDPWDLKTYQKFM